MASKGACKAESCHREAVGKGYCDRHYRQWKQGKLPKARYATCKTKGCKKPQVNAAHCAEHQKVKKGAAEGAAAPEAAPAAPPAQETAPSA